MSIKISKGKDMDGTRQSWRFILKAADPEKMIKLSTEVCNMKAQTLYLSLGFEKLAEMDGDDLVFGM